MKVNVERCWSGGGDRFTFRLTLPDGSREIVSGQEWNRRTASEALDVLESVYHLKRTAIRFVVH